MPDSKEAPDPLLRILQELADIGEPLHVQLDRRGFRVVLRVEPLVRSVPAIAGVQQQVTEPAEAAADSFDCWASGPEPKHSEDFRLIYWPGLGLFQATGKQAVVVRVLWKARTDGLAGVHQRKLLDAAGSDSMRLADLFSRSPLWKTLIVSPAPGLFALAPLPVSGRAADAAPG
jgi:hypothetical protein